MKCSEIISEMPMNSINFHGNMDSEGTFRKDDIKKFNDPKWNKRVISLFKNSPYDINLHILNGKEDKSVDFKTDHFTDNLKRKDVKGVHNAVWVDKVIGYQPDNYENSLNILMIYNEGDDRVGLTPWIIAHRIGHIFMDDNTNHSSVHSLNIKDSFQSFITTMTNELDLHHLPHSNSSKSELMNEIAYKTMTFKSARNRNLNRATEALIEMFAQFIIKGAVVLKKNSNKKPVVNDIIYKIASTIVSRGLSGASDDQIASSVVWRHQREANKPSAPDVVYALRNNENDIIETMEYYKILMTNQTIDSFEYEINKLFGEMIKEGTGKFLVI